MKFTKPKINEKFTITSVPEWPTIEFETDASGPHTWVWALRWGAFTKSGTVNTPKNKWEAKTDFTNLGGTLTVTTQAKSESATISVFIQGTNPSETEVKTYLSTKLNSAVFDKIVHHEAQFKHFNSSGEPIKSFDNGYGMCQLTTPPPSFEKVWNWKLNMDGRLSLFDQKRAAATSYLSTDGRSYTDDQLKYEAVCRWNGGSYHVWDAAAAKWVRKANILCDSKTGNLGWDMNDPANNGKTETDLRSRDQASYGKHPADAHWAYFGVCYADAVLR